MDLLITIDGDLPLKGTEERCEVEQNAGFQLENIKFGTVISGSKVFQVNKAEFDLESSVKILNALTFTKVGTGDNANTIKDAMTAEGRTFICDTQLYVEGQLTRVLVFGKKV
jgi:hypothetical protein